tara:strand:+ start:212 stop:427 length:216 start_codon:yes stop_codon:yes gene_type:complete
MVGAQLARLAPPMWVFGPNLPGTARNAANAPPHGATTAPTKRTQKVHHRGNENGSCTRSIGIHPREAADAK